MIKSDTAASSRYHIYYNQAILQMYSRFAQNFPPKLDPFYLWCVNILNVLIHLAYGAQTGKAIAQLVN